MIDRKVFNRTNEIDGADNHDQNTDIVLDTAREVFRISAPLRRPQDTGGVFLMTWNQLDCAGDEVTLPYTDDQLDPRIEEMIGALGPNDGDCPQTAREKAVRLLNDYLESDRTHHCSWQTRNPDKQQYGGAIMAHDWVLSFSGCSEMMDEAICLCVARVTGLHSETDAEYIAAITGNELYPKLMELVTSQLT